MPDSHSDSSFTGPAAELDRFDVAILNLVQENNQLNSHEIGARVGLSPSAVQRRLRRLRETGVIVADVSLISRAATANRLIIIVDVSLEREQTQQLREFERTVCALPEVVQCYYITGRSDFVLILNVQGMDAYREFTQRVFFSNSNVKQFHTAVVMDQVKFTTRVALPHRGSDRNGTPPCDQPPGP
jgi:Lrp/AsnC family transcriptional regulator, leucine-responsive regulatory protein